MISNKTCKKILQTLAEREMSESEIAKELKIPINTVDYNIKKLYGAGLVDQSKRFLWSEKGKRIYYYKISDKRIVISPKSFIRGVIPAFVASLVGAFGIYYWFEKTREIVIEEASRNVAESAGAALYAASDAAQKTAVDGTTTVYSSPWMWFLMGAWIAIVLIIAWNRRR